MRKIVIFASAMLASLSIGSVAQAKVGDAKWAECVWQTDAAAADNWLAMKAPTWMDKYGIPAELLGLRLSAVCDATPADPKKPNRILNWKSMQQQLRQSKPKSTSIPVTSVPTSAARLCEYYAVKDNQRALYLIEAIHSEGGVDTTIYQGYFAPAGSDAVTVLDGAGRKVSFQFAGAPASGTPMRMPQDTLIASPSDGFSSEKTCRSISADGSLTDA